MKSINLHRVFADEVKTVQRWSATGVIAEHRINWGTMVIWVRPEPSDDLGLYWSPDVAMHIHRNDVLDSQDLYL